MTEKCSECGAPLEEGLACCRFCNVAIAGRDAGVVCPGCGELATDDRQACAACGTSFHKGCIFCGEVAFLSAVSCARCGEAFEGAEARKAAREEAAKQQQMMGLAQQGLSVIGQAVGTPSGRDILGGIFDAVLKSNDRNLK